MTAVRTAPATTPRTGFENISRIFVNSGTSASGLTAELIVSIPNIRIANPTRIIATFFFFSLFENMKIATPMTAMIGENEVGFNS